MLYNTSNVGLFPKVTNIEHLKGVNIDVFDYLIVVSCFR